MGRTRANASASSAPVAPVSAVDAVTLTPAENAAAVTIAAALGGAAVAPAVGFTGALTGATIPGLSALGSAVAAALFLALPAATIARLGEAGALQMVRPVAAIVSSNGLPSALPSNDADDAYGLVSRRRREELLMRAYFAVNAVRRLVAAEDKRAALGREVRNFRRHIEESKKRLARASDLAVAAAKHGPVLGWKHGRPKEPRLSHLAADGKNFDVRRPLVSTGALPGVLFGCTCTVVAPHKNAGLLN